jgi:hypothetical protein
LGTNTISRLHLSGALFFLFLGSVGTFSASAQSVAPAPLFPGIPFERWLAEGGRPQIRWTTLVAEPGLSIYQRLTARVEISVDGEELVKRRGHGQLYIVAGFEDSDKHVYRTRHVIDLQNVDDGTAKSNINVTQTFFLKPGDYRISLGVLDASNGEHSITQRMLHVAALHSDPLPDAWKDLPPVEVIEDPPDEIFLPSSTGRLHLPLESQRPVHIELLVNTSRSTAGLGPKAGQMTASTLGEVIPAMKVISQTAVRNGTMSVAVLDLARHKVIFEQDTARGFDWPALRGALSEADPNVIDVHSLENRKQDAQFFVKQMSRRIESAPADDALHVIIVLSGPMSFAAGADLHPLPVADAPNTRIYYLRYHSPPIRPTPAESLERSMRGRRGRNDPLATPPLSSNESVDSLANTIKPLRPRLFDIYTPGQFRKALSNVLDEISRM